MKLKRLLRAEAWRGDIKRPPAIQAGFGEHRSMLLASQIEATCEERGEVRKT